MNSTLFLILIVSVIFGSAGVMFLRRASQNIDQQNDSGLDGELKDFNTCVFTIVGGWFVICVFVLIYFGVTRFAF